MSSYWQILNAALCLVCILYAARAARQNIALYDTYPQQSSYLYRDGYYWIARMAIDNKTWDDTPDCQCCSGIGYQWVSSEPYWDTDLGYEVPGKGPYWEIDLGQVFNVWLVKVVGKHDSYNSSIEEFWGFHMFVSESTPYREEYSPERPPDYVYNVSQEELLTSRAITHIFFPGTPMRYVAINLPSKENNATAKSLLVLCEVEIYDQPCPHWTYGASCDMTCGNCYGNITCHNLTGTCQSCDSGYYGELCETECTPGTYGPDCQSNCGNCRTGDLCDIFTGSCPGRCSIGFGGNRCDIVENGTGCSPGTYGDECQSDCGNCQNNGACDVMTGSCIDGCAAGYQGDLCLNECNEGFYGLGCAFPCANCTDGELCNKITGYCPGDCSVGFQGPRCDETCAPGKHGINCQFKCGKCMNDVPCNATTGACMTGCAGGFKGEFCNERIVKTCSPIIPVPRKYSEHNSQVFLFAVGVAGSVGLLVLMIVVVFLVQRRKVNRGTSLDGSIKSHDSLSDMSEDQYSGNSSEYSEDE